MKKFGAFLLAGVLAIGALTCLLYTSQKRRMEEGVVFGRSMLGYDVRNGKRCV